jgi:hypothetical protein
MDSIKPMADTSDILAQVARPAGQLSRLRRTDVGAPQAVMTVRPEGDRPAQPSLT